MFSRLVRTLLVTLSVFVSGISLWAKAPQDSTAMSALDGKLDSYIKAIEYLDVEEQKSECGFLISSCSDSLVRQHVALRLYSHFLGSELMNSEAVAIGIADGWFFNGKVKMLSDIDLMNARIFAEFNRSSLVGERAPELTLCGISDDSLSLFRLDRSTRYSILYFYDTGCPNCLVQSVLMRNFLHSAAWPLDFYAVYTGVDSLAWKSYVADRFDVGNPMVNVHSLWDSEVASDFQRKYGVLQTPQMLLVGKDNVILGRRLDVPALSVLLGQLYASDEYEYGGDVSNSFFDNIIGPSVEGVSTERINALTDRIVEHSGESFSALKETVGDLFYYLSGQSEGRYKEAEKYLVDKYVLSRPDIWDSTADSMKVVNYAAIRSDLLSRAEVGSLVPDLVVDGIMARHKVPDAVRDWKRDDYGKASKHRLPRLRKDAYVMFYDDACSRCRANMDAADSLLRADRKMRVLFVRIPSSPEMNAPLLDSLDLTSLPFIMKVDRKGQVTARYVEFTDVWQRRK